MINFLFFGCIYAKHARSVKGLILIIFALGFGSVGFGAVLTASFSAPLALVWFGSTVLICTLAFLGYVLSKQLTTKEKRENAQRLFKAGLTDMQKIADVLSVDPRSALNYTEKLREDAREKRDAEILELYLQCWTQEEIAKKLEMPQQTVSERLTKNGKFSEIGKRSRCKGLFHFGKFSILKHSMQRGH